VEQIWELVCDPRHLPRWWPRVTRVEGVHGDAFTEVMLTRKGKVVRADFDIVRKDAGQRLLTWAQRIQGTPFASVISAAETDVQLTPVPVKAKDSTGTQSSATKVTLELRQTRARFSPRRGTLTGLSPLFGARILRRASERTLGEALDGLEQIGG
jgi:uncharacterized protein YndB with AHSA1/START domain